MTRNRRKMIEQMGDSLLLSKHSIQLSALFLLLSGFEFEKDGKRYYSFWTIFYDFGHSEAVWLISSYFVLTLSKKIMGKTHDKSRSFVSNMCTQVLYYLEVSVWLRSFKLVDTKYRTCSKELFCVLTIGIMSSHWTYGKILIWKTILQLENLF